MVQFWKAHRNFISSILLIFIKRNVQKYQKQYNKATPNSTSFIKANCYKSMQEISQQEFSEKSCLSYSVVTLLEESNISIVNLLLEFSGREQTIKNFLEW